MFFTNFPKYKQITKFEKLLNWERSIVTPLELLIQVSKGQASDKKLPVLKKATL